MLQTEVITIFNILIKGFIIGIIVSAQLGPIRILCIQRTLNKGRWYGFVTGLGASLSDIIYAVLTGYGMSFISDFIEKHITVFQLSGSVMLFVFGIYTLNSNPVKSLRPVSTAKGTYFHNYITSFFVNLSNPLIIFLYIGLYARFAFAGKNQVLFEQVSSYVAITLGALCWWFFITFAVNKVRKRFNLRGIWMINRVIGTIVIIVSIIGFVFTLVGKNMY